MLKALAFIALVASLDGGPPAAAPSPVLKPLPIEAQDYRVAFPIPVYLRAANEGPLDVDGPETYRFVWLPSWDEHLLVRVRSKRGGGARVVIKRLNRGNSRMRHHLIEYRSIELSPKEWESWLKQVEAAQFWGTPLAGGEEGLDGSTWLLEGVRGGRYHAVQRWSPRREEQAFADLCRALVRLVCIESEDIERD